MKVLSLLQPWATLVAIGAKKIETRSWNTKHRGQILIHASAKRPNIEDRVYFECSDHFRNYIINMDDLPYGAIIAVADLTGTGPTEKIFPIPPAQYDNDAAEYAFGDYTPGRFGWLLSEVVKFAKPISAKGSLGLWDFPNEKLSEHGIL